jgi:hypothetical protein
MNEIDVFIQNNIKDINSKITLFKNKEPYNDTIIKNYLQNKLAKNLEDKNFIKVLLDEIEKHNYVKARIEDIANKHILYKSHLDNLYKSIIFGDIAKNIDCESYAELIIKKIKSQESNEKKFDFVKSDYLKILKKCMYMSSIGGFSSDIQNTEMGLRVANEGDSAQFLFLARAIGAGFNCSNVDVRSSGYDAIIDVNSQLLKIQIKGVQGDIISFWNRARGGQGIDSRHERNQGKRITSKDCDLYVAVDKQIGICYIIPMAYADSLSDKESKSIKVDSINEFRENWAMISNFKNI